MGDVENIEQLACELGCKAGIVPSTYVCLPLGTRQNSVRIWEGIEERFRRRLTAWKRKYISKGGRLTLIKSTLSNLPIYLLSLFRLPKGVKCKLKKIQREFLWGGGSETRKIHLVNWRTVSQVKGKGGLGIRNLNFLNRALLGKWIWRFVVEESSTWKVCISTKYGIEVGGWYTLSPRGSYGLGLWKAISKETSQLKQNCELVLRDGKRIRFWEDTWCGGLPLSESFPALFNKVASKGVMIAGILVFSGDQGVWDPKFERPFNDWELEAVQTFIGQINSRFASK